MSNFKPGDRIRRIDPSLDHPRLGVRAGQIYTVLRNEYDCVYLKEAGPDRGFAAAYFVLHQEAATECTPDRPFQIGDLVRRVAPVRASTRHPNYMKQGGQYFVTYVPACGNPCFNFDNYTWRASAFELVLAGTPYDLLYNPNKDKPTDSVTKPADPAKSAAIQGGLQKHSVGDFYPLAVVGYGNGGATKYVVENLQDQTVACCSEKFVRQWGEAALATRFLQRVANKATDLPDDLTWLKGRPAFVNSKATRLVMPGAQTKRTVVSLQKQDDIIEIKGAYYKAIEQDIG